MLAELIVFCNYKQLIANCYMYKTYSNITILLSGPLQRRICMGVQQKR